MLVRKNYYLYEENNEKQQEKRKILGSVRITRNREQWAIEIQWKNESEAEALATKAGEIELQLKIREKEIILGQEKNDLSRRQDQEIDKRINEVQQPIEESEEIEESTEIEESEKIEEPEKIEEGQKLPVTATESKKEEDKQEQEEQPRKIQSQTSGEDRNHQPDQEWELVRRSCHRIESCKELGEVYRINKGEFAVLPDAVKHILQNSFLVHGLMNYGYLLLFRTDEKLKQFGVGVPGVYYEKEKLVAEMFGFPQFWCDGKLNNGKFGYYLRIVS